MHLISSRYEARTEHELPVLVRYIPKELLHPAGISVPDASVLDLILYSREQIAEEYKSMGRQNTESLLPDAEWSIISVKPQAESYETPMQPITMCVGFHSATCFCHLVFQVLTRCLIQDAQQLRNGGGRKWCASVPRKVCTECGLLEYKRFNCLMIYKQNCSCGRNQYNSSGARLKPTEERIQVRCRRQPY